MNDKAATPASEPATTPEASSSNELSGFGEGDLGRLQGILFGDHAKKTQERIDTLERALLGALADLKDQFTHEIAELSSQLAAESSTRSTAIANVTERVATESKSSATEQRKLQGNIDKSVEHLTKAVDDASTDGRIELEAARRDLQALIESAEATMSDRAVDRNALSDMLASLASDLKG